MNGLAEIVRYVRERSPYYRDLYRDLPETIASVSELPPIDPEGFWLANGTRGNRVLTGPILDGLVLRSGGTTGRPKFSIFARAEWDEFTRESANLLAKTGLRPGDRVANLFYTGELYGSFLFVHRQLEICPTPLLSLPIGGAAPIPEVVRTLADFDATVVAALPTTIMALVAYLEAHPEASASLRLRLFLFAGEALYPDQRARIARVCPGAEIRSIGYASNDAGFLGYADETCGPNEFRRHDGSALYEIVDEETGAPIREPGVPGRALVTNLRRRLMPILRYPVGDRAQWIDPEGSPDRRFLLLGRSEEAARIASISLYYDDVRALLERFRARLGEPRFQMATVREDERDGLVLRVGATGGAPADATLESDLLDAILRERPAIRSFVDSGKILPPRIEWREPSRLETNPRTGKLKRIIDERR